MAKNYKTIALTGTEQKVALAGQNCDIRNDSVDIVYVSADAGITSGADGVLSIPAGQAAKLLDCRGALYILGTGSVMLCGNDYSELVFKTAASVSSGGGGTVDDVARQAIASHANNDEIHVTAAEKAAWNNKAELSDIPTTLPANGGVADIAKKTVSPNAKARLWEDDEGGNLQLVSPDDNHAVEMDFYNNSFRMVFRDNDEYILPVEYNSTTKKFNINGNAATLGGKTAAEFVLKSEYDALAARVAALENGT